MIKTKINIPTTRVFRALKKSQKRIIINVGGAGSSKSYSTAQYLIEKFITEKHKKFFVCRKTLPALKITAYYLIVELLKKYQIYNYFKHNRTDRIIYNLLNNNFFYFSSIDDPEKIKSSEWNYIWIEEAIELTLEDFLILYTRLRAKETYNTFNQIILTLNPSDSHSWIYEKLMKQPDVEIIQSTYKDNPYLPESYKQSLEHLIEQDEQYYKIYTLGEWTQSTNKIYTNWQITEEWPKTGESIYGLDFGFNNPTALVEVKRINDSLYIRQLLYQSGLTNNDLIEKLKLLIPNRLNYIYCDTEDPQAIECINRAGFNAHKADKDVLAGIKFIKQFKEFLYIESVDLIEEQKNYMWKTNRNGEPLDEPVKFRDHLMDAKRYAIYTYGKKFWINADNNFIPKLNIKSKISITEGF